MPRLDRHMKYVKLNDQALPPIKGYPGDAGWDLPICKNYTLHPNSTHNLSTGISIQLPGGYFSRITNRSSTLSTYGLVVREGIIDNEYRGELSIVVSNTGSLPVILKRGDRLAQLLIHRIHEFELLEVDLLTPTSRGTRGFGSTGRGTD